jgi:hypothetical protein
MFLRDYDSKSSQIKIKIPIVYRIFSWGTFLKPSWDTLYSSVADPYVFGPPGSGSFYDQSKRVIKTLIPTVL